MFLFVLERGHFVRRSRESCDRVGDGCVASSAERVRPASTACRRYAVDCERRRRSHCGKPHVQPRRGLTWGKVSPQSRTSERFCCGRISGVHCLYHDRASPKLDGYLSSSVPTLSISDAERGVYHDRRVSDAPIIIVSSTR